MNNKHLKWHVREWSLICGLMLALVCFPVRAYSLSIDAVDSSGNPFHLDERIKEVPEVFVEQMETALAMGNLDSVRFYAEKLVRVKPEDANVRALLSLSLASGGEIAEAEKQLAAVPERRITPFYRYCAQAMILKAAKKLAEARSACTRALSQDSRHPYAHNLMGRILLDLGQTDKARASFKTAIELNPDFLPAYINLGAMAYLERNYVEAVGYFTRATTRSPGSFNARYGLAVALESTGDVRGAIRHYRECLAINPSSVDILAQLATLELNTALYREALATGQKLEDLKDSRAWPILAEASLHLDDPDAAGRYIGKIDDKDLTGTYLRAYLLMIEGKDDQAMAAFDTVINDSPDLFGAFFARQALAFKQGKPQVLTDDQIRHWGENAAAILWFYAGAVEANKGAWDKAYLQWEKARGLLGGFSLDGLSAKDLQKTLKPDEMPSLMLGVFYLDQNFSGKAMSELKHTLTINPASPLANYFAAAVQHKMADRERALELYKASVTKAPRFFPALYAAGEIEATRGQFDQALSWYAKASEVRTDYGILIKQGLIHEMRNAEADAEVMYRKAIEAAPDNFIGYNQLAWLFAKQGKRLDEALILAEKADRLIPGNGSVQDTLGWIRYQQKDYVSALGHLESARNANPDNPTVLYHLGVVYHAAGRASDARKVLAEALSKKSPFADAGSAETLLNRMENDG